MLPKLLLLTQTFVSKAHLTSLLGSLTGKTELLILPWSCMSDKLRCRYMTTVFLNFPTTRSVTNQLSLLLKRPYSILYLPSTATNQAQTLGIKFKIFSPHLPPHHIFASTSFLFSIQSFVPLLKSWTFFSAQLLVTCCSLSLESCFSNSLRG